ncbi:uncharacterized protein [Primulina huaijiensis]|uniref:uncharacterized protein isoform X2 n=1 Tax=Primulina huaijiensis TaxID=1492673 RepID=UPI003CC76B97
MGVARLLLRRFENGACSSSLFRIRRFFSTSTAMIQRPWIYDLRELEESIDESTVYRRALKFQRPTTVRFEANMLNSASLIGFISAPFKNYDTASGRFGVYTSLKVDSSARAYRDFMVMLEFWDDLAEIAVEHLKLRDLIYVSGSLVSYKKMDEDGKSIYRHKLQKKRCCGCVKLDSVCGRYSSAAQTSGGIIDLINGTQINLTSGTRIPVKHFGLKTLILHGSKSNFYCTIQG